MNECQQDEPSNKTNNNIKALEQGYYKACTGVICKNLKKLIVSIGSFFTAVVYRKLNFPSLPVGVK